MSHRLARTLVAGALLALAAAPALAADKVVDASRVFTLLEDYLKLPSAERSHFTPAYYLHLGPQPLTAPVWLVDGGQRTPIPLRADGKVERLPNAAQLAHGKVEIGIDEAVKLNAAIGIEPTLAPAADLDAHELAAAVAQAAAGIRKAGGIKAMLIPKLHAVGFVGANAGEVEFADGRRAPLPVVGGVPTYDPAILPNARRIHFAKPPLKLDID